MNEIYDNEDDNQMKMYRGWGSEGAPAQEILSLMELGCVTLSAFGYVSNVEVHQISVQEFL